jgi:DNA-directed RNA polymerase sigma subunit (sigma70/sigma32)
MTQKQVAERMGISLQRVQQIEKRALTKLRRALSHLEIETQPESTLASDPIP